MTHQDIFDHLAEREQSNQFWSSLPRTEQAEVSPTVNAYLLAAYLVALVVALCL